MKLFHFTGEEHLRSIQLDGLTIGGIPDTAMVSFGKFSWLTNNPEFVQPWSPRPVIANDGHSCDRTSVRLTLAIPKSKRRQLIPWEQFARYLLQWPENKIQGFGLDGEGRHWFIFLGRIPSGWIRAIDRRPKQ